MIKTEFPWQFLPANLIAYDWHHSRMDSEFERQVGFLLIDVGVETTLNVLRSQPDNFAAVREIKKLLGKLPPGEKGSKPEVKTPNKTDDEKIGFHHLVEISKGLVQDEMEEIDWKKIEYFHNKRNKLYHDGDGVTPWISSTIEYADMALKLLRSALGVDLQPDAWVVLEPQIRTNGFNTDDGLFYSFDSMAKQISGALDELADELSVITEVIRPKYTSRKFLIAIIHIRQDLLGKEDYGDTIEIKAAVREARKQALNDLLGVDLDDFEMIDQIIGDPRYLWFHVGLKKLCGKKFDQEFDEYLSALSFIDDAPLGRIWIKNRNPDGDFVKKTVHDPAEIYNEFSILLAWIERLNQKARAHNKKIDSKTNEK